MVRKGTNRRRPGGSIAFGVVVIVVVAGSPAARGDEILIPVDAEWQYFKGTEAPPPDWTELDFDDSEWLTGATGIGYGDADDATVLTDMQNGYFSVFCRHLFEVDDPEEFNLVVLRVDYDDGFVAYLNGTEVARAGLAGIPPAFDEPATSHEAGTAEEFVVLSFEDILEPGENVLAVEVHNTTFDSSDLSFIPELVADPLVCPSGLSCSFAGFSGTVIMSWTTPIEYDSIEIVRNGEIIEDLDGDAVQYMDLEPPPGDMTYEVVAYTGGEPCPPLQCTVFVFDREEIVIAPGDEWLLFRGSQPFPIDWDVPDFDDSDWEEAETGIGYGDGDDAFILADMQDAYLAILCRAYFDVDDSDAVVEATLSVVYDDGVLVTVNGEEVGRANLPAGAVTEQTAAVTAGEPTTDTFQIPLDLLEDGENVIAVSVHNANLGSSDLSFIPTLIVRVDDGGGPKPFRRGDVNDDDRVNLTDPVFILDHLFRGGPPPTCFDAADTNDDGRLNLTDPVFLLDALFRGGARPPAPGMDECGEDLTEDELGACDSQRCAP